MQYAGGAYELRLPISGAGDGSGVEANFRGYTGSLPDSWQAMTEVGRTLAWVAGDYRGDKLDFRARVYNSDGETSYFSDVANVPSLAIDNAAPSAPAISGVTVIRDQFGTTTGYQVTVTGSSITAAKMVITATGAATQTVDWRPGNSTSIIADVTSGIKTFTATAYASNGTAGPTTTLNYNPISG